MGTVARRVRGALPGAAVGLLMALWLAPPILGQAEHRDPAEGYGGFHAGLMGLDLEALNSSLVAAGLPTLDETGALWGGGGYGRVGRFYFGAVGYGGLDPAAIVGTRRTGLKGGFGLVRAKYEAISLAGLSLSPALGAGAGGMGLQIAGLGAPTFDDVLADPERSASLSTGIIWLLNAGLALDYRFQVQERENGGAWGIVLGVEGGYMFAPGGTSWELDGLNNVIGGPALGIEGFYVWFSVGGWGREGVDSPQPD